jgi:hypothetical protein
VVDRRPSSPERGGVLRLSAEAFVLADDRRGRYLPVDEPGALRAAGERDPAVLATSPGPFILGRVPSATTRASPPGVLPAGVGKAAGYRWCPHSTV